MPENKEYSNYDEDMSKGEGANLKEYPLTQSGTTLNIKINTGSNSL